MKRDDSLQQALETCLAAALQIPGIDAGGIYLVDAGTGDLDLACCRGVSPGFAEAVSHVPRDSERGTRVHARQARYVHHDEIAADANSQVRDEGLLSTASIPVAHGDEVLAALNVASRRLDAIPPGTRQLLEGLASLVGVALHRSRAEQALRESEARYRALVDSVPDLIAEISAEGVLLSANPALLRWLNREMEDVVGHTLWELFASEAADRRVALVRQALAERVPVTERTGAAAPGHDGAWLDAVYAPVTNAAGETTHAVAVVRDVTGAVRTEQALRQSEERYELATQAGRIGVWDWDVVSDSFYLDATVRRMLGYDPEELPNHRQTIPRLTHPADRPAIRAAVDEVLAGRSQGFSAEHRVRRKDGTYGWFLARGKAVRDADGKLVRLIGTSADISEQKAAEERQRQVEARLQQAEKLQSLAILAGGIAHDFNNLLTGVVGNVSLARRKLPSNSGIEPHLNQIETAAVCAADLAGHMLAYSGHGRVVVQTVDLADVVHEMSQLARAGLSPLVAVRHECQGELPPLRADATQLRQLVLNLITNAADAIGSREGLITLRTGVVDADRERLSHTYVDDGLPAGRYVSLRVSDTGDGMGPETVARIFDPFFTTKVTGRGLGLSSVLGIVRGHRGAIEVHSRPGEGTVFEVLLPVATAVESPPAAPVAERPVAEASVGTVLVAEDEAIVRVVAQSGLEQAGFATLVATDGGQAVRALETRGDELVGVVLDVTMPVVSGTEIYRLVRQQRPDLPVLVTSGFAEQEMEPLVRSGDPTAFLRKPYRPEQLAGRLRDLIAAKGASA